MQISRIRSQLIRLKVDTFIIQIQNRIKSYQKAT